MLRTRRLLPLKFRRLNFKDEEFSLPAFKKEAQLSEESRKIDKLIDGFKDSSHLSAEINKLYNPYKVLKIDQNSSFKEIAEAIEKNKNQLNLREERLGLSAGSETSDQTQILPQNINQVKLDILFAEKIESFKVYVGLT